MATPDDKGGGLPTGKAISKSISRSNMEKSEALKRKLKESLHVSRYPGYPHTLGHMTKYDIRLPNLSEKSKDFRSLVTKLLIDNTMLQDLNEMKIINFCRTIQKMFPLKTAGDGNCLLHAVSMAIWGIHDKAMLLRRLVYISLVEDDQSSAFHRRWERERARLHESVPEGLELSSRQWATEWEMVVQASEDVKKATNQPGQLDLESLEEIHIFVLANVIQRPIVVLSDTIVRSLHGSVLGPNNFSGIYLPLLWQAERCSKNPVVLGYHFGHFTPLVNMEPSVTTASVKEVDTIVGEYAVPLVNKDIESLYIHFLSPEEDAKANELLQKYMRITEINWTRSDGLCLLLSAKLEHTKIQKDFDLITDYVQELEKKFTRRKVTAGSDTSHSTPSTQGPRKQELRTSKSEPIRSQEEAVRLEPTAVREHLEDLSPVRTPSNAPGHSASSPASPGHSVMRPASPGHSAMSTVAPGNAVVSPAGLSTAQPHRKPPKAPARQLERLKMSPKRSPQGKRCLKRNCEFYGSLEFGGYCFQCFVDTTKGRQQPRREAPQQQVEYVNSMSNDPCIELNCVNMASTWTHPYCHVHARDGRGPQVAPVIHHHSAPTYIPSITDSKCAERGCKNVASTKTFPFCHEHNPQAGSRDPGLWTTQRQRIPEENMGPTSVTPYQCPQYGCMNFASSNTYPYCHEHASASRRIVEPSAPTLYTSNIARPRPTDYEPSMMAVRCSHTGCVNMASINTFPHCHEHHTQQMPRSGPMRHTSLSRYETGSWDRQNDNVDEPRSHSLEYKAGQSKPCREPGCPLYGPPGYDYYCPEHHRRRKENESQDQGEKSCLKPFCRSPSNSRFSGLCAVCFAQEGFGVEDSVPVPEPNPVVEDPFVTTELTVEDHQAGQEGGLAVALEHPERALSLGHIETVSSVCIAPACSNPGSPTLKGLCGGCYSYLSLKPKRSHSASVPAVAEDGCRSSSSRLPSVIPCTRNNCNMHGKPEYGFYCFDCYQNTSNDGFGEQTTNIKRRAKTATTKSSSEVSHLSIPGMVSGAQSTPVVEQSIIAQETTPLLYNSPPGGDGFTALRKLEDNVRSSRRKCRTPSCKNFGNPSKRGYCNICYG